MGCHAMDDARPAAARKGTGKRHWAAGAATAGRTVTLPRAGQRIVYHCGRDLSGCRPQVARAMREAAQAGLVDLVQRRLSDDGDHRFAYEAVGRTAP